MSPRTIGIVVVGGLIVVGILRGAYALWMRWINNGPKGRVPGIY